MKYEIWATQGQAGCKIFETDKKQDADICYMEEFGKSSIGLKKNGKFLTDEELCKEFGFNKEVLEKMSSYFMKINQLYGKLRI